MGASLLELENVTIRFGGLVAVSDVSLCVSEGELVGLIGPNGAGKTTVFNMITGVYQPTDGKIMFAGKPTTRKKPHVLTKTGMARTFQNIRDEPATSLPYGGQRRLEIVRALATQPKLLLLDEPAAGMNPSEKEELMLLIEFIRKRFGMAILLVEHDMKVVMGICERIAVLEYGIKIAEGTPKEIQSHPKVIEAYLGASGD